MNYSAYLKSDHWRRTRARHRDERACYCCGRDDVPLQLHHRTYFKIGREGPRDLVKVCDRCHDEIHELHERSGLSLWRCTTRVRVWEQDRIARGASS